MRAAGRSGLAVAFLLVLAGSAGAARTEFSDSEIVFPLGREGATRFLELLKDPANGKVTRMGIGPFELSDIPGEATVKVWKEASTYLVYWDDFNHDGKKEYLVAFIQSGTGNFGGVQGVYSVANGKLKSLGFNEIVVKSLFPGKDMSSFHGALARPFVVRVRGKTYLRFLDGPSRAEVFTYRWAGKRFRREEP